MVVKKTTLAIIVILGNLLVWGGLWLYVAHAHDDHPDGIDNLCFTDEWECDTDLEWQCGWYAYHHQIGVLDDIPEQCGWARPTAPSPPAIEDQGMPIETEEGFLPC